MSLKSEERIREEHKQNFFVVHGAAAPGQCRKMRHVIQQTRGPDVEKVRKSMIHDAVGSRGSTA
jgi:hypothetical protein